MATPSEPTVAPSGPMQPPPQAQADSSAAGPAVPGKLVNGGREVVWHELNDFPKARLPKLFAAFFLGKTGNKATLTEHLQKFSADQQTWVLICERAIIDERRQKLQVQLAALTMALACGNGSGVASSTPTGVDRPGPPAAHSGPDATASDGPPTSESEATPSEATVSHERPPRHFT
ncbi:hypothetical protein EI94DRAFT_1795943 [Lactarius quietus]|nr:hypothetical protein EI94DRAFT_1795943 [Lactarius quietus]